MLLRRETVTWRLRLDSAIAPICSRPLGQLDSEVISALRIGAVQLLLLDTPPHAAVSATVGAVSPHARSFVNAVLRKLAVTGEPSNSPPWVAMSHPSVLWKRWSGLFGEEEAMKLMQWNNSLPSLGGFCFGEPAGDRPGLYLERYRYFERSGAFDPARFDDIYYQDEGAAVVSDGAASLPGDIVVEVCAAPGGKTAHLAGRSSFVLSLDSSLNRMARWKENARRLGWTSCGAAVADGASLPVARAGKVIVDAPCTGTGVYRRRNDARWGWSGGLLGECVSIQRKLLASASSCLGSGGWLIYSACSLEQEETLEQASWFESSYPCFVRRDFPAPEVLVRDGMLCIFPPRHHMDGHFAVCWERV